MNIQAEHKLWADRMFPGQLPSLPAAVMLEEAGELVQALSKASQERVYGKEPRYSSVDWKDKLEDAIGDCAIAACSLCNANGWDFEELLASAAVPVATDDPLYLAVDVVQVAVCVVIDPQDRGCAIEFLGHLRTLCASIELSFEHCVFTTWDRVKRRTRTGPSRPKVVCLCGSTRFKAVWYEQTKRLTYEGIIVLGVGDLNPNRPDTNELIDAELKAKLDELHLRKIDAADEVLVLNVGGYIGDSTRREIEYATKLGKPVRYLE